MSGFFRKLGWLAQRRSREQDLAEELRFHLEEDAELRREQGADGPEAQRAARRELGNLALVQEDTRAVWGWTALEQFAQDMRYALRAMSTNRLFTALALVSLALGIGANAAIYSFMDVLLLRSLPVAEPGRLALFNWHARIRSRREFVMHGGHGSDWGDAASGTTSGMFPYGAFDLFRKDDSIFSSVFGYFHQSRLARRLNLAVQGEAGVATVEYVSGEFFSALGVPPAAGRLTIPDDDRAGASPTVVVSYELAERRFGGAAKAPGQTVLIDNSPYIVTGVAPPGFFGVDPSRTPDLYIPLHANPLLTATEYQDPNDYWIEIMGRLRPDVSLTQAEAVLAPQFHHWVASTAKNAGERAQLPELVLTQGKGGLSVLRRRFSKPLYVLLALVALILAIACANVANLLLARASARRREIALRLSVGASRLRVVRQMLTESVLLASLSGVLGVALAMGGIRFLTLLMGGGQNGFPLRPGLNWRVLCAMAALSLVTGVLFGLAPALQSTRVDVMPALKETRVGQAGGRHPLWGGGIGRLLVIGQIALSLLMLVAAGLFVRTLSNLESVNIGFNRDNVLLFHLEALKAGHKAADIPGFYGELRKQFSEIPGVRAASLSDESMIDAGWSIGIHVLGAKRDPDTRVMSVGPAFFEAMGIPILLGRGIDERDRTGSPQVAVVSERFAKLNFGDRNPLGQRVIIDKGRTAARDMEIVGVSRDTRYGGLKQPVLPLVFFPYDQGYPFSEDMVFALRTAGDPLTYVNAVREIVRRADAGLPVADIRTQAAEIDGSIRDELTLARLCTVFALLALTIACVGLYGTVAYNVARRTSEIGIRMALGAQRGRLVWLVLREVLMLAGVGIAVSVPMALAASKLVESLLFGVRRNDPWALATAVATLLISALAAAYLPARRASRIDPMAALRHE